MLGERIDQFRLRAGDRLATSKLPYMGRSNNQYDPNMRLSYLAERCNISIVTRSHFNYAEAGIFSDMQNCKRYTDLIIK